MVLEHDSAARERLLAEVRKAKLVSDPNECRVFDVGDVQGGYFLTMEDIDGEDPASLLRRIGNDCRQGSAGDGGAVVRGPRFRA